MATPYVFQTWTENAMHIEFNLEVLIISKKDLKQVVVYISNIHIANITSAIIFKIYESATKVEESLKVMSPCLSALDFLQFSSLKYPV